MKDKILFSLIGLVVGFVAALVVKVQEPAPTLEEIQSAMTTAAESIEQPRPLVNLQMQTLDWGQIQKLKLKGDFVWSPRFHADNLILEGHQATPYDSTQGRTRSLSPSDTPNAVTITPFIAPE